MVGSLAFAMENTYLRIRGAWATMLFNPIPPLPPSVDQLIKDPSSVGRRHHRRNHPSFSGNHLPDSPLASLYRIYEFCIIDKTIPFRNEIEYFWNCHRWAVHDIPDPEDTDPLRYAILAGLTEILCLAFNRLINKGLPRDSPPIIQDFDELAARPKILEKQPEWATKVAPLPEKVFVPNSEGGLVAEEKSSPVFGKYNVFIEEPSFYFV